MSLTVITADPGELLRQIRLAIDAGVVATWTYDSRGYFTHKAPQWRRQAWLKPILRSDSVQFVIVLPKGEVKRGVEGVYQGRFSGMLQTHFEYTAVTSSSPRVTPRGKKGTVERKQKPVPIDGSGSGRQRARGAVNVKNGIRSSKLGRNRRSTVSSQRPSEKSKRRRPG